MRNSNDICSHYTSAKKTADKYDIFYSLVYAIDHLELIKGSNQLKKLKRSGKVRNIINELRKIVDLEGQNGLNQ